MEKNVNINKFDDCKNNANTNYNNVNWAIINLFNSTPLEFGLTNDCTEKIEQCQHLKLLSVVMNSYNKFRNINNKNYIKYMESQNGPITIVNILNNFHHLLSKHDNNDYHIKHIFETFGVCNIEKCTVIPRFYRGHIYAVI